MIEFNFETDFQLQNKTIIGQWITDIIIAEGFELGEILYVFCNDEYLHKLNIEFLNHDTLTDIISFDYCLGEQINGEIYISVDRVADNAENFKTEFDDELHRVMIHGILHFCGYKDKSESEAALMRGKENEALKTLSEI